MTAVKETTDLGRLDLGANQVFVGLLPTGSSSVMVKYKPFIQLSCVIPPKDFNINFSSGQRRYNRRRKKDEIALTTPTLLMSCTYNESPSIKNYKRISSGYSLWALDTEKKSAVWVKPYLLANVWERGEICFGRLHPQSLRQAYNYYWTSGFNDELYRNQPHECENKSHSYSWHRGCFCDKSQRQHQCRCPRTTHHDHLGCGCTTVSTSKKCRGTCSRAESSNCVCCKAILKVKKDTQEKSSKKKLGTRTLAKLAVMDNQPYPACGCGWRHKRVCSCSSNSCECPCNCGCCTKTCNHPICVCTCCNKTCDCRCACNSMQKFKYHMGNYHEKLMPAQEWKARTSFFCGEAYWASPKSGTGILITNDKALLLKIPRQFWRKDKNGQAMAIALATKSDDGWKFESGNYSFSLDPKHVMVK